MWITLPGRTRCRRLPDPLERAEVVGEESAPGQAAEVEDRRVSGRRSVYMGVHQEVVVEAEDRVVERGVVEAELDPRRCDQLADVRHGEANARGESVAYSLLVSAPSHCLAVGISHEQPDPG